MAKGGILLVAEIGILYFTIYTSGCYGYYTHKTTTYWGEIPRCFSEIF